VVCKEKSTSAKKHLKKQQSHRIHGAGIYANIWGILMGSMLPYIAAPWIRHGNETQYPSICNCYLNLAKSCLTDWRNILGHLLISKLRLTAPCCDTSCRPHDFSLYVDMPESDIERIVEAQCCLNSKVVSAAWIIFPRC